MDSLTENLCKSIEIISKSTLEGIRYDTTQVVTIVDNSKKSQGTYIVSDGSNKFTAYSNILDYNIGTNVYILIPEGDLSNDKIILSKKVDANSVEPFLYKSPFSYIVDITGNLNTEISQTGLIANNPNQISKVIADLDFTTKEFAGYRGFERLGIRADFKAWLKEMNCVSGNYGIKITITCREIEQTDGTKPADSTRDLYLNVSDMLGDPYAFESYFTQEKVVDISSLGTLTGMKIEFYQDAYSFIDKNGNQIPYVQDSFIDIELDENIEENWLLPENLFVNNIWVCLGFDSSDYSSDFVQIYSFNNEVYNNKTDTPKKVSLKWVHIEDDIKAVIDNTSKRIFEIRWYRNNKNGKADEFSGYGWEAFDTKGDTRCFEISFIPDGTGKETEQIKAIILYGDAPEYIKTAISHTEFKVRYFNYFYKNKKNEYIQFTDEDTFKIDNEKEATMNCYYRASDNREIYKSNILTFTNQNDVANNATIDAIKALSLLCRDYDYSKKNAEGIAQKSFIETQGNYYLYNETGGLIDIGQKDIGRYLQCKFDLNSTENDDSDELRFADKIIWEFPIENTMIIPKNNNYITSENDNTIPKGYARLIYENNEAVQKHYSIENNIRFEYTISQFYNSARDNNLIKCIVEKDRLLYSAVKELKFGQAGSSGTAFTFTIDFPSGINAITLNDLNGNKYIDENLIITAHLYDQQGYEIDIPENEEIEWKWYPKNISEIAIDSIKNTQVKLIRGDKLSINQLCILQATLKKWRKSNNENEEDAYDLVAYLPIPIRLNPNYLYINGPDKIVYLTDGYPVYYKDYFNIIQTNVDYDGIWRQYPISFTKNIEPYMPKIITDEKGSYLQATSMYIEDLPLYGIQYLSKNNKSDTSVTVKWTQPILIYQSLYPSSILNEWDGKTVEIKENSEDGKPSYILSNILGAGSKNSKNQFSGIMLGDVEAYFQTDNAQNTLAKHTGLFGFSDGAMCFSFTDDGKATIGKSTAGQLLFDGKKSTISSNLYQENILKNIKKGMILDFDDGYIKIYNNVDGEQGSILLDTTHSKYPLIIGLDQSASSSNSSKFKVAWDGSLRAEDVYINGELSGNCYVRYGYEYKTLTNALAEIAQAASDADEAARNAQSAINGLSLKVNSSQGSGAIKYRNCGYSSSYGDGVELFWSGGGYCAATENGASIYKSGNSIYVTSACYSTSAMQVNSDIRLKENIYSLNKNKKEYLDFFQKLTPKTYNYKATKIKSIGFIAQDIEKLAHNFNLNTEFFIQKDNTKDQILSLNYDSIFTLNVLATQNLYDKIEELQQEIKELKERLNNE